MELQRRDFLKVVLASGAAMSLPQWVSTVDAATFGEHDAFGTARTSRLFPDHRLVHSDLHNHSHMSDGRGSPANFYTRIRAAGIDVAALTDHATIAKQASVGISGPNPDSICGPEAEEEGKRDTCHSMWGLDEEDWQRSLVLADAANVSGTFVGMRGFEWSDALVGHSNVWFSSTWIDPLADDGIAPPENSSRLGNNRRAQVRDGVSGYYNWLLRPADYDDKFGGGGDSIFGFNHPGREPGLFADFRFEPALLDRMVSVEMFNKGSDYLFKGVDSGRTSPLVLCLDAGWKPGIIGTSDEHDPDWGSALGKGKGGLWVTELSRNGVREAMESRRFFATREKGLRLDAAANGQRMGQTFGHTSGTIHFELDIAQFDVRKNAELALEDGGSTTPPVAEAGQTLIMQILQTGTPLPTVVWQEPITVPKPSEPHISVEVPIDITNGAWVVVRLCDPSRPADGIPEETRYVPADSPYRSAGRAVAYASPWYLRADMAPPSNTNAPGPGSPNPTPIPVTVTRIAGPSRVETAIEVSKAGFAAGNPAAYVTTARNFPDALAAVPAAYLDHAPVLLVEPDQLHPAVVEELRRLNPARITVLGGEAAVSAAVADQLAKIAPVERVAGSGRAETAANVAAARFDTADVVGVASGRTFPDALSGGPAMTRWRGPLLLVEPDDVPVETSEEIERLNPSKIVVFGGDAVISSAVETALGRSGRTVTRYMGSGRFDTSAVISRAAFTTADEVLVTTGRAFPDALAAGALAAQRAAPILLVEPDAVPPEIVAELDRLKPKRITIIGGRSAVSQQVENQLKQREAGR